ncbi:MAG TPA: hypothetical protein VG759_21600 [Candidatus Angelobacter sp.]|jgi:hypothetical protein|nr:hypothetical protein [Candidatus Angelobacter sp.]
MAKLINSDGTITDITPRYPAGFLPSELKKLLATQKLLFIPLNQAVIMIIALENAELPTNEMATMVARKILGEPNYEALRGPALLANTDDLQFWLL